MWWDLCFHVFLGCKRDAKGCLHKVIFKDIANVYRSQRMAARILHRKGKTHVARCVVEQILKTTFCANLSRTIFARLYGRTPVDDNCHGARQVFQRAVQNSYSNYRNATWSSVWCVHCMNSLLFTVCIVLSLSIFHHFPLFYWVSWLHLTSSAFYIFYFHIFLLVVAEVHWSAASPPASSAEYLPWLDSTIACLRSEYFSLRR